MTDSVPVYEKAAEMNALWRLRQRLKEMGRTQCLLEECQEPCQRSSTNSGELVHRSRILPVPETKPVVIRRSSQIDDETTDDQTERKRDQYAPPIVSLIRKPTQPA